MALAGAADARSFVTYALLVGLGVSALALARLGRAPASLVPGALLAGAER